MSSYDKRRAKLAQLSLEDIRALNASLSELAEASKAMRKQAEATWRITPPPATLTMSETLVDVRGTSSELVDARGTSSELVEVHGTSGLFQDVGDIVTITTDETDQAPAVRQVPVVRWLDELSFFIPKSIREPFLGDLREDLANKAAKGHSRASVWWAAISQIAILALRWAWSNVVRG